MQPTENSAADLKARFDFILRVHVYTHEYIRFADTKASFILAACGFLFAAPLTRADALGELLTKSTSSQKFLLIAFGLILFVSLGFTVFHCIRCVYPRLNAARKSLVYFGDIVGNVNYVEEISQLTQDETTRELAKHVKDVSATAISKYLHVQQALVGLAVALATSSVISFLLVQIARAAN